MKAQTKVAKIAALLDKLEPNTPVNKDIIIQEVWGITSRQCDYFVSRSFDVAYSKAKKLLPKKEFVSVNRNIYLAEL